MEAEEVKPLGTSREVRDPCLLRVQSQPDDVQDRRHQLAGLLGLLAGSAQDHEVIAVYDQLLRIAPTPVAALNRAIAVAMARGPERGLALIDEIRGLDSYHLLHSARAELLRRASRPVEAADAYRRAIDLARNERERALLERRLAEVRQLPEID
jgi:predicted RNA polymerase sigma factor